MKKLLPIILLFASGISYSADIKLPIEGITDGDTIKTSLNLPCPLCTVYVRIRNIDTPETSYLAKCSKERHLGAQAKDYLNFATRNKKTMIVKIKRLNSLSQSLRNIFKMRIL